jgi:hypothetical protein
MINYKQLMDDFASIAYHHEQIRSFGFGDLAQCTNDIETKQEPLYTRMYIVPQDVFLNQNHIHYNLSIIIMDRVNTDLSNLKDVFSDTLETTKDIWTVLLQSYTQQYGDFSWDIIPDQNPNVASFLERFETIVAGWTLNVSVQVRFDYDKCTPPVLFNFQFPQDHQFQSYKLIIDDYQKFADLHEQINSFGFGDIPQLTNDIETNQEPLYPRMYVHNDLAKFHVGNINLNWKIFFIDRLTDDLSNQIEILSDMLEVVKDLFSKLYLSDFEAQFDAVVNPFFEKTETTLGGWILNLSFTQKYDWNRCVLPIRDFASPSPTPSPTSSPVIPTPTPTQTLTPTPSVTPVLVDGIWMNVGSIWDTVNKFWGSFSPVQPTPTPTASNTPTPSITQTNTPTPSITPTITPTNSLTPTMTPTVTVTSTYTPTPTPTSVNYDPSATAFINAAGITGFTNQNAINNLVVGLKTNNLWNKMIIVYPFIQGTATSNKYNLKDPRNTDDAFRINWYGGMSFNQSGITSTNTINGYGNTHWSPYNYNENVQTIYNNISTGIYRLDQNLKPPGTNNLDFSFGARTNQNASFIGNFTKSDDTPVNHVFSSLNEGSGCPVQVSSQTGTTGFFVSSRVSDSQYTAYKNGVQFGDVAYGTVPTPPTGWFPSQYADVTNITLLSLNLDGTQQWGSSRQQLSWFHLSTGLDDSEVSTLNNIVQQYQTSLNRNI